MGKASRYFRHMLKCAHKSMLLALALDHEKSLGNQLAMARAHFGEQHRAIGELRRELATARECRELLEAEPVLSAA